MAILSEEKNKVLRTDLTEKFSGNKLHGTASKRLKHQIREDTGIPFLTLEWIAFHRKKNGKVVWVRGVQGDLRDYAKEDDWQNLRL